MPSPGVSSVSDPRPLVAPLKQVAIKFSPFDQHHYQRLIRAREEAIRNVLHRLSPALGLKTALDAGAGVGFFSQTLADCGLSVSGFDGRAENVVEARKRFPHIAFQQADLEDRSILALGKFDLVLCFGLLYHLENPLLAIRHLRSLTEKCLLLESMCVPDDKPSMLLREEPSEVDQGLTDVACYPSEDSLIKMLYRAGFGFVYRLAPLPKHDDFCETFEHRRKRTVLLASSIPVDLFGFRLCLETHERQDPWTKVSSFPGTVPQRIARFLALPGRKKYISIANHIRRIFPATPIPWRLPFGAWCITLVTPVYNGARFIEETIRSIVYQGYPNLELYRRGWRVLGRNCRHHSKIWKAYFLVGKPPRQGRVRCSQQRLLSLHRRYYGLAERQRSSAYQRLICSRQCFLIVARGGMAHGQAYPL